MANSDLKARWWLEFLANEPAVRFGSKLRRHFDASTIVRLCECGCNSFDVQIPDGVMLDPIAEPGKSGKIFEVAYNQMQKPRSRFSSSWTVGAIFASIDVTCGDSNQAPLPDDVGLGRVTYAGK